MAKYEVPKVKVKDHDGNERDIPFTVGRAHEIIIKKSREDFNVFFQFMTTHEPGPHQKEWYKAIQDNNRVLIISPRGFGKTDFAVYLMAWFIGHNPITTNAIVSVSNETAKARLAQIERIIEIDPKYKLIFPWVAFDTHKPRTQTSLNFIDTRKQYVSIVQERLRLGTDKSHSLMTTSPEMSNMVGNRISGVALIDDLHDGDHIASYAKRKKAIDFYNNDLYPSLYIPTTKDGYNINPKIIIIGTRWAEDDICGYITDQPVRTYTIVDIPAEYEVEKEITDENGNTLIEMERVAAFPQKFPLSKLDEIRNSTNDISYGISYLNKIASSESAVFDSEKLRQQLPNPLPEFERVIMSIDPAYTKTKDSDFTAIATLGIDKIENVYLLDLVQKRMTPDELSLVVSRKYYEMNMWLRDNCLCDKIIIENNGTQFILSDKVAEETKLPVEGVKGFGNKKYKANNFSAKVSHDQFFADWNASWAGPLRHEMLAFPSGRHDDMVDAIAQGINYFLTHKKRKKAGLRIINIPT